MASAFSVAAPTILNQLPSQFNLLKLFQKKLATHLSDILYGDIEVLQCIFHTIFRSDMGKL